MQMGLCFKTKLQIEFYTGKFRVTEITKFLKTSAKLEKKIQINSKEHHSVNLKEKNHFCKYNV